MDDCINTTTARSSGTTIRNDLTIDVNSLLAKVLDKVMQLIQMVN